jgi:hypothetical protein
VLLEGIRSSHCVTHQSWFSSCLQLYSSDNGGCIVKPPPCTSHACLQPLVLHKCTCGFFCEKWYGICANWSTIVCCYIQFNCKSVMQLYEDMRMKWFYWSDRVVGHTLYVWKYIPAGTQPFCSLLIAYYSNWMKPLLVAGPAAFITCCIYNLVT